MIDEKIVPMGTEMTVDWPAFRREAAKDILCSMIEARMPVTFQPALIWDALMYTNALIEKLKQE